MMQLLYEKYRPKTFAQVLGQPGAVKRIQRLLGRGWGGQAWWLSGASGTGKTTLARIIAEQGAEPFYVTEINSADELSAARIDEISRTMHYFGGLAGDKIGRAWIINEAHGLRKTIIRRLLGVLESIPQHCVFIFTTTKQGQAGLFEDQEDAGPLLSRCARIELTNQGLAKVFGEHCRKIAQAEKLDGKPPQAYIKLAQSCKNNCRAMLQEISSGYMIN